MGEYRDEWRRYAPLGGTPINLAWEYYRTTDGWLHHPGDHPAFGGELRWGRLKDGRPWVEATFLIGDTEWAWPATDEGQRLAELAVLELKALRDDDQWEPHPLPPVD